MMYRKRGRDDDDDDDHNEQREEGTMPKAPIDMPSKARTSSSSSFQLGRVRRHVERNPYAPSLMYATTGLWSGEELERLTGIAGVRSLSPVPASLTTSRAGILLEGDTLRGLGGGKYMLYIQSGVLQGSLFSGICFTVLFRRQVLS
jgi:hypothetical protein